MNHLTKVKLLQKLNQELKKGIPMSASWHTKVFIIIIELDSIKTVHIFMLVAFLMN